MELDLRKATLHLGLVSRWQPPWRIFDLEAHLVCLCVWISLNFFDESIWKLRYRLNCDIHIHRLPCGLLFLILRYRRNAFLLELAAPLQMSWHLSIILEDILIDDLESLDCVALFQRLGLRVHARWWGAVLNWQIVVFVTLSRNFRNRTLVGWDAFRCIRLVGREGFLWEDIKLDALYFCEILKCLVLHQKVWIDRPVQLSRSACFFLRGHHIPALSRVELLRWGALNWEAWLLI